MAITQITNNVILDGTILPAKLNISPALKTFLGTATSANLASAVSGTTGSGNLVFADSPTITTPTITSVSSAVGNPFTISTNYATSTIANVAVRNQATNGLAAVSFLTPGYTANGFIGYGNASSTQYTDQVFFCSAGKLLSISTAFGSRHLVIDTTGNVGIGTTTPSEKLTVSGNISASGNVTASNLVYTTSDQTIAGVKTFSDNIVGNGTANRLPNQLAVASSDIIIKGLADSRYTSRNKRITDDTTFVQTTWEQFLDFDDQYNQDLNVVTAFGAGTFSISPGVFGDVWTTGNAGVAAFSGNDAHTHRGIFLVRGPTTNNAAFYIGIARTTIPYNLTNRIDEFTCRVFVGSNDFTTQGYFKIGPIPKGGTGTSDTSLRAGLIFNPYFHATNLVLGAYKSTTISPFTFTTNPLSADFLDTGVNFIDLMDKWVNITYKIDRSVGPTVTVIITRENAVLFEASYNVATHPVVSTWARRSELYTTGASNEIGIQSGKFTYTTRSQIHIDYLHYKVTGTSAAPSNWNSLRF